MKIGCVSIAIIVMLFGPLQIKSQIQQKSHEPASIHSLPITFEPASEGVGNAFSMIGRADGATVVFQQSALHVYIGQKPNDLEVNFVGAQAVAPHGVDLEKSRTNYMVGDDPARWRTHVANYGKAVYTDLYPGVDVIFYGNGDHLEHDFIVKPGADYRNIRMRYPEGASTHLEQDGTLVVETDNQVLRMKPPVLYQNENGMRLPRRGAFRIFPGGDIGFSIESYDKNFELVIDPVLTFSTYISTSGSDANRIAVDGDGNSYVVGYGTLGYPVTAGAFSGCSGCTTSHGVTFISKVSADGSSLVYSTILGGNNFAQPTGIAVDASGNAIVAGWTAATNFPTKSGQTILPQANNYVGFLVSLTADGSALNYGTLLGPSPSSTIASMTYASAVAVDSTGNAYVSGTTGDGFFVSSGALNQAAQGNSYYNTFDVYLAKFDPSGTLLYSALLGTADPQNGGGGPIGVSALAVDSSGNAYVAGQAGTLWPVTSGAYQQEIAGANPYAAPFVMKVAADAKSAIYSTYLDYAYQVSGLAALADGNVLVTGNGAGAAYPTTADAYEANNGTGASFLTELNAAGSALVYSTMLCGGQCSVNDMAIDTKGNIWLAGQTGNAAFPLVLPLQSTMSSSLGSGAASFVSEFDAAGKVLEFSTYLGGAAAGYANGIAVDSNMRAHVSGAAGYGMFTTQGVYDGSVPPPSVGYGSSTYPFVAMIDPSVQAAALCISPNAQTSTSAPLGGHTDQQFTIQSCGAKALTITSAETPAGDFSVPASENGCTSDLPVGQSCTLSVRFAPTVAGTQNAALTVVSNAPIPASVALQGYGITAPVMTLSAKSLSFGSQLPGTESAPQTITITNTGNATLYGIGFGMTSADELIWPFTYTCGPSLDPGASCAVNVSFKPSQAGTVTTSFLIENSSGLPFQQVSLSGSSPQTPFALGPQSGGSMSSTVQAGATAGYALQVTPAGGYSGTATLSCSNLPAHAACTFSPSSLALAAGAPANVTLSISTKSSQSPALARVASASLVLACLLFLVPRRRSQTGTAIWLCVGAALFMAGISACGGGSSTSTSPQASTVSPGTYTIHVLVSDTAGNQLTQNVTLIVQ